MTTALDFTPLKIGESLDEEGMASPDSLRTSEHPGWVPILRVQPTPLVRNMLLGALRDPRLRLKAPLPVEVNTENEYILVEYPAWGVMGYGTHLSAALIDLQQTITELFFTLKEDEDNLGGDLPGVWANIQQAIEER